MFLLFSYLSVIDLYFLFYSVVIREHNLHYVEVCFVLWPRTWSILLHAAWTLEKNVNSAVWGWSIL